MKCIFATSLIVLLAGGSFAQQPISLAKTIRPGTRLIYSVEAGETKYHFTVTVQDIKGRSFHWAMDSPVNKSGNVQQSTKALQNADVMYNHFANGLVKLDDHSTSVWLSQRVAKYFNTHTGEKPIAVYAYGGSEAPLMMNTFTGEIPVEIKVNGVTRMVKTGFAKPLIQTGRDWVPAAKDEFIHYNQELAMPLIIDMTLDFSITLEEIITK
jgi:hypothetical protein